MEDSRPRTLVQQFGVRVLSPPFSVQIISVTPQNVFEVPIVNPTLDLEVFSVEIRLNASLDFERVRMYTVYLRVDSANGTVQQSFNVHVTDVNEPPVCDHFFQFPGAEVQIPESLSVPVRVYNVLASDPDEKDMLTYTISKVQPISSRKQFQIDGTGVVTSNQSFDYQNGPQDFVVSVTVSDQHGANCSGTIHIKVLKVFIHPLTFIHPSQNVSIVENKGNDDFVATVTANASDISYTFVEIYPPYKIDKGNAHRWSIELTSWAYQES
nr:PREDICTED: protocadherin-23-like [Lepisosteus oculatus]